MSKGPGKWQSRILAELKAKPMFYLGSLLGTTHTKAQYNALLRAATTLEEAKKINICHFLFGPSRTVIYRLGFPFTDGMRRLLDSVSVGELASRDFANTYNSEVQL